MYDRFGYHGMLAAYNAGPGRYLESLRTGRPLPAETRAYVRKISGRLVPRRVGQSLDKPSGPVMRVSPPPVALFALRPSTVQTPGQSPPPAGGLFAITAAGDDRRRR